MFKASIELKTLRSLVKATLPVARAHESRPILRNILLKSSSAGLEITATDTLVSMWFFVQPGDELSFGKDCDGEVVISASDLHSVLESIGSGRGRFSEFGPKCVLKTSGAKFTMVTEDARDFPKIVRFDPAKPHIRIQGGRLSELISRSAYCAHDEESFYLMHGLLLKAEDGALHMAATNGQRLGVAISPYDKESPVEEGFKAEGVIPALQARMFRGVFGEHEELVDIQWLKHSINVRGPRGEVTIRALSGNFPDYKRGVPDNSKIVVFNRKGLSSVLRQTSAFKSPGTSFIQLDLRKGKATFSSLDQRMGDAKVDHEIEWEHDPLSLILNPEFMLQTVGVMGSETLSFEVEDVNTQTLLRENRDDDITSFCVLAAARR